MEFSQHNAINGHYCPACGGGNTTVTGFMGYEDYPRQLTCLDCQARERVIKARQDAEWYPSARIVDPMVRDAERIIKSLWAQDVADYHGRTYRHDAKSLAMSGRICASLIAKGML